MITVAYVPEQSYGWVKAPRRLRQGVLIKQCTVCRGEFPATADYFYRKSPLGALLGMCRSCKNAQRQRFPRTERNAGDPNVRLKNQRRWRRRRQAAAGKFPAPRHYWTAVRVAAELDAPPEYIYRWARQGRIPAVRHLGRYWRFDPAAIAKVRDDPQRPLAYDTSPEPRTKALADRKYQKRKRVAA